MDKKSLKSILLLIIAVVGIFALIKLTHKTDDSTSPSQTPSVLSAETKDQTGGLIKTSIGTSPYLGDKSIAKVAVIEFSDFECPYCKNFFEQTLNNIVSEFVDTNKIIFVYRDFMGVGLPAAEKDSVAALCVFEQSGNKAYFDMAHLIYQNTGLEGQGISAENMNKFAVQSGANQEKFSACLSSDKYKGQTSKDTSDAQSIGITGTPSFVVGTLDSNGDVEGELLVGAQPISTFENTISKYLK